MKVIDIMEELEDSKDFDESVISEDPPVQLHNLLNGYMYVISQCICGILLLGVVKILYRPMLRRS